jgi:dihydrofolate reductase
MGLVTCQISISLDGFVAGPEQSPENPIGVGGIQLHEWAFVTESWRAAHGHQGGEDNADAQVVAESTANVGAYVMGRRMFGGGEGPWDPSWKGWWGEDPPFHVPVFVLTHHVREPLSMAGGTSFTFVTDGLQSALGQARAAAGQKDVAIAGGASAVQQCMAAGELDELHLHIVPIILGSGERLLEHVGTPTLELASTVASPSVTHVKYRIVR